MQVRMLRNEKGSEDGRFVKEYLEGKAYDLPQRLATAFVEMGAAKEEAEAGSAAKEEAKGKGKK